MSVDIYLVCICHLSPQRYVELEDENIYLYENLPHISLNEFFNNTLPKLSEFIGELEQILSSKGDSVLGIKSGVYEKFFYILNEKCYNEIIVLINKYINDNDPVEENRYPNLLYDFKYLFKILKDTYVTFEYM